MGATKGVSTARASSGSTAGWGFDVLRTADLGRRLLQGCGCGGGGDTGAGKVGAIGETVSGDAAPLSEVDLSAKGTGAGKVGAIGESTSFDDNCPARAWAKAAHRGNRSAGSFANATAIQGRGPPTRA
jgi:hypothetical protein